MKRIGIVNRGESARRLIRAVRDHVAETGDDLQTVALVTPPDLAAPFAREADHAVPLAVPEGSRASSAYLDHASVLKALQECFAISLMAFLERYGVHQMKTPVVFNLTKDTCRKLRAN